MKGAMLGLAAGVEKLACKVQGKGSGSHSIAREVAVLAGLAGGAPKLALDIGGNVGEYSAGLKARFPGLEVHVFEPSSMNIAKLQARFGAGSGVTVVPFAVSDRAGEAPIYSNAPGSGLTSLSMRKLDHLGIPFAEQEVIRTLRVEDYWRETLGGRAIDLVKIDIEGHELAALQGFGAALPSVRAVQFEFGGANIDTRTYFRDFWYLFTEAGFDLYRITPLGPQRLEHYRERDEFFSTTNYVAVHRA
ncbi:FkbM family methyltransferase [Tabrizicola sp. M-4]|uniref:FkbM family methyltransferase n=1 Tax=Tabrizicola sp. M-4 TaxID=3055847 RepID=UPI003DA8C91B